MGDRPTVYLSNWSSWRTEGHHGPGLKLTIMAKPRSWEHGDGKVSALVPDAGWLRSVQAGDCTLAEYRRQYECRVRVRASGGDLKPGRLMARKGAERWPVEDGDTLCCACSRDAAARGECHRVWAAHALAEAGWRVVLDGEVLDG